MPDLKHLFANNQAWADSVRRSRPDFFTELSRQQSPEYLWIGSIGVAVLVYLLKPIMGAHVEANQRIRMIGSRFSPLTDEGGTLAGRPGVALDDRAIPDPRQGMISQH